MFPFRSKGRVEVNLQLDLSCPPPPHPLPLYPEQKILTMTPTEEEKQKIQDAQLANPQVPLGTAEQFLLSLASISALAPRLQLWAFKLNYEALEKVRSTQRPSGSDTSGEWCFVETDLGSVPAGDR